MALPRELQGEVTTSSSTHSLLLGYALERYVLTPVEDTVRIQRGGHYAYPVYDELLRDARVFGAVRKRIKETTKQEWEVVPASDDAADTRAADLVRAQLEAMSFDTYQRLRLGAIVKGLTVGEALVREPTSRKEADRLGKVIYHSVAFRPPWYFRFAAGENGARHLRYVGVGGALAGEPVEEKHPRKFLWYAWGSEYGDPYGKGLGHQLYWPTFMKRQTMKVAMFYADKFGMPTVDVEYDPEKLDSMTDEEFEEAKAEAKTAGQKVRTEGLLFHSNAFVYKLLEAQRRGDIKTYTDLVDYCDREIAIVVTGATLSLDLQGEGARAATETHQADLTALAEDDAAQVCERDNDTLVRWITELNVPDATPPKVWRQFPDSTDYAAMAKTRLAVMQAVQLGHDADDAERTFGFKVDRKRVGKTTSDEGQQDDGQQDDGQQDDE